MRLLWPLLLLIAASPSSAYKILVYNSKFGHSHSNFLGSIADALVDAGHNVTSLIPIIDPRLKDGTVKSTIIHVQPDRTVLDKFIYVDENAFNFFDLNDFNPIIPPLMGPMMAQCYGLTCAKVLAEPGLIERLRTENYDVYIAENFDVCGPALAKAIGAKTTIGAYSSALAGEHFAEFGIEEAISYRPAAYMSRLDVHSMVDRAWNIYASLHYKLSFWFTRRYVNSLMTEHFGSDYPSVAEQSANVAYVLTNSEPLIDYASPTLAKVLHIAGIGAQAPKPLDEVVWTEVLSRRERTILFSLGSVVKSTRLVPEMKAAILETFARFPDVTFIWKYEEPEDDFATEHASKLANLVLTKWMPQRDLLADSRIAVFITHGGMGSTQETAISGVPGIFIPIFGDQRKNAGMMEYNGFRKVFDKYDLADAEKFSAVIREVLGNSKYRENARRVAQMIAKKPFSSKELLIKHVEFAAEFGASSALRSQSVDMSFIEYHNLDVIVVAIVIAFALFYCSFTLVLSMMRRMFVGKAKQE